MSLIVFAAHFLTLIHTCVTIEFVQDNYTVYECYPVAGYLRLVNESTEVFVTEGCLSLLACEGFRISVRDPGGRITMIPEEQHSPYRAREPVIELRRGTEVRVPIYLQKCKGSFLFREKGRYEIVFELKFLEKTIVHEVEVVGNGCRTICDVLKGHRSLYSPYILGLLQRIDEIADRLRVDDACEDMVQLLYDYHGGGAYARSVLYGSAYSDDPKSRDGLARRDGLEAMSMEHT